MEEIKQIIARYEAAEKAETDAAGLRPYLSVALGGLRTALNNVETYLAKGGKALNAPAPQSQN